MTFSEVDPKYLVDIFDAVVEDVRDLWDSTSENTPYYMHGHPKQVLEILKKKDKSDNWKYRKYPLVILLQDFIEQKGINPSIEMSTGVRLIIVEQTLRKYEPQDRYDKVFRPILYPIYEQLLESMAESGLFNVTDPDQIQHTKTDRLFWGREGLYGSEQNIFDDYLDAIDITFQDLQILAKPSC